MPRPKISLPAQEKIAQLTKRGITPTPEQIVWLHELGKRVMTPLAGSGHKVTAPPVLVGGVWLRPFTIGAGQWYADVCWPSFGETSLAVFALGFTLSNSRNPEMLWGLIYQEAKRRINEWKRSLSCTLDELVDAIDEVLPPSPESKSPNAKPVDWDAAVSFLCTHIGHDPHYWTWDVDRDFCLDQIDRYLRESAADGNSPDANAPLFRATQALQEAFVEILTAHEGKPDNGR